MAKEFKPIVDGHVYIDNWPQEELVKTAREELKEKPDTKNDIKEFRERIINKSSYDYKVDSDEFLLKFLRARKYNQDRALKMYKNYCAMRSKHADLYDRMTPENLKPLFESNGIGILPYRDRKGRGLAFINLEMWDTQVHTVEDIFVLAVFLAEKMMDDPVNQINGFVLLFDVKGMSFGHIKAAGPTWAIFLISMIQDVFPVRVKGIHLINQNIVIKAFSNLVWPFLSKKLKSRLFFYDSDLEELHKQFSPEILPAEFGGKMGPYDAAWCIKKFISNGRDKPELLS